MEPRPAWHSALGAVYHTHLECEAGDSISLEHIRYGTGCKPLCKQCARMAAASGAHRRPVHLAVVHSPPRLVA